MTCTGEVKILDFFAQKNNDWLYTVQVRLTLYLNLIQALIPTSQKMSAHKRFAKARQSIDSLFLITARM